LTFNWRITNIARDVVLLKVWTLKQARVSRVIVERLKAGDDVLDVLNELVLQNHVSAGSFTAIGAVEKAVVGYFLGDGKYSNIALEGPLEVVSCLGNVSMREGVPFVHAHITLSDNSGKTYGGHLMPGSKVGATFEVTLHSYAEMELVRKLDPATKLYLLDT
jgi:predicted DNA-binding protein with PD1-like motif